MRRAIQRGLYAAAMMTALAMIFVGCLHTGNVVAGWLEGPAKDANPPGRYDGATILSNDLKFSIGLRCATRDCIVLWPDGGSLVDTSPSCLALHVQQAKSCAKVARQH